MSVLNGIKIIEMAGLAPSSFCGMILSDFGADVVVIDRLIKHRKVIHSTMKTNPLNRGKTSIQINLKTEEGVNLVFRMIEKADILIESYRPGVMEKLGLGPDITLKRNPKLIYARLTGWGQTGSYATMAGHDINYIAISGLLSLFRRAGEKPLPPLNLLGDFAGGSMLCVMGILLSLIERNNSGKGQVVDSAIIDGVTYIAAFLHGLFANHLMTLDVGTNRLDGGAPFYQTYKTLDEKFIAVGSLEPQFYSLLLKYLGIDPASMPEQNDQSKWLAVKDKFTETFITRTRDEWADIFNGTDACVTPILAFDEVMDNCHNQERKTLVNIDGILQPAPAPRLSRTPGKVGNLVQKPEGNTRELLQELGLSEKEILDLRNIGVVE
jgi:alpha-methylacyl-CoA racemase